jgi:cytochrome c
MNSWFSCRSRRAGRTLIVTVLIAAIGLVLATARRGQAAVQATRSVFDRVYTEEQAKRGKVLHSDFCALCHGDPPTGTPMAPGLAGDDFLATYNGMTVADLFSKISKTMPADDPGKLKPQETADVVAYLLSANKWPADGKELPTDLAMLKEIRILAKRSR